MDEIKQYYDITDYSFKIGIELNKNKLTMKRDFIMSLVKSYIDDELSTLLDWTTMTTLFTDTIDGIYSSDNVTRIVIKIFRRNLNVLVNNIIEEMHVEKTSFIISKLIARGRHVLLEVENCGDYRIVAHELRVRGINV